MRILFLADGRSPTALNWMRHFVDAGHEVHLVSTFVCQPNLNLASLQHLPVAFSAAAQNSAGERSSLAAVLPTKFRTRLRQWLGPLTLRKSASQFRDIAAKIQPDLIHAMRIPFEGMLSAGADLDYPLLVSVWGNDFTLHGPSSPLMRRATRRTLARATALHTDTQRDLALARSWGFDAQKPAIVLPGNGGIRMDIFYPLPGASIPDGVYARMQVINPRGLRSYVRNDVFFKAIPLVLRKRPEVRFLCPAMEGEPEAEKWVTELGLEAYVQLMPKLGRRAMADTYHAAQVMVSPSTHDGTPNSLLEAMASGVFPVVGDIDSVREWITDGENGLLVNPNDAESLAKGLLRALKDADLRARAAKINSALIQERADYGKVMAEAEAFYQRIIG
ncbi:MAG: glycosyltransferase [Chloroflexi bacterium]|nr:glycosyltransferase [Chloroflexota bacterium]